VAKPAWFDWLTVVAIVAGPVLALFTQRLLDVFREKKQERIQLYLRLMGTRAAPTSPEHVQALNSIDVVFSRKSDQGIRQAWERFLAHVALPPQPEPAKWWQTYLDLKIDLMHVMGTAVGYDYTTAYLRRQIYAPQGYSQLEEEQRQLRQGLGKILTDDGLKVSITPENPKPV
jgi:Family of unknown function (DUF6680)